MPTISPTLPNDGDDIDAADVNDPLNAIIALVNGNLDANNLADDAVTANKLATSAVTNTKILDNTIVLEDKMASWNGWIEVSDSWTYASATTVTVPTDATTKYSVGDRIQFNQSGIKYFQITTVAATTLTLAGVGGTTVANAAISDVKYSKVGSPVGFSQAWQSWTPTFGNFTAGSATITGKYIQIGKTVHFRLVVVLSSSTMGTSINFTIPVTAADYGYSTNPVPVGHAMLTDQGVADYPAQVELTSTTVAQLVQFGASTALVTRSAITSTSPFTWGNTDKFAVTGTYEAA